MKNIVIMGDSYSTYEGYVPEGYSVWYTPREPERSRDVVSVECTWWRMLARELELNVVQNNSWSGSTVSYIGWEGDCSETSSFIRRAEQFIADNFFEKNNVDTLLIFGATNDSWVNESLGELKFSDIKREDLYSVLPAISKLIGMLREACPTLNIIYVINTGLKPKITEAIIAVCKHYGVGMVELHDIAKEAGHPTALGMTQIKDQIKEYIESAED